MLFFEMSLRHRMLAWAAVSIGILSLLMVII